MVHLFQKGLIAGCFLLVWAGCLFAQTVYVSSINEITMRAEPGVENRIVEILKSGTPLTIIEYKKDWSKVQSDSGKQGWVLTRFITEDKPKDMIINELSEKNQALTQRLETLRIENQALTETNETFKDIEKKYIRLKEDSVELFSLQEAYDQVRQEHSWQAEQITELESRMRNDNNIFFLSGAGVFIFGLILGISTRKKRRKSLL